MENKSEAPKRSDEDEALIAIGKKAVAYVMAREGWEREWNKTLTNVGLAAKLVSQEDEAYKNLLELARSFGLEAKGEGDGPRKAEG